MTWEILIVVHPFHQFCAGRHIGVARQQGIDIVWPADPRFHHERQVRRQSAIVPGACRIVVRKRLDETILRLRWAVIHFAFVVWPILYFVLRRERLYLRLGVTKVGQVAEIDQVQAMTARAALLVNLQTTLH